MRFLRITSEISRTFPGKVRFGVTIGNFVQFSEWSEFEYRARQSEAERMIAQGKMTSSEISEKFLSIFQKTSK